MTRPFVFTAVFLAGTFSVLAQLDLKPAGEPKSAPSPGKSLLKDPVVKPGNGVKTDDAPAAKPSATGKPGSAPKGPTEITAREATFDQVGNVGIFSTGVIVKDPQFNITCEKLTVVMKTPPEKDKTAGDSGKPGPAPIGAPEPEPETKKADKKSEGGMDKAIAETNVVITQDKVDGQGKPLRYIGKARKAVFDSDSGNVVLTGMPTISQSIGGNMSKQIIAREESTIITINNDKGTIVASEGYSTTSLSPDNLEKKNPDRQ